MKCTIGEYKRFIHLKYGGHGESTDRNSSRVPWARKALKKFVVG